MITATFKENTYGGNLSLTVKGHANSAAEGEDLICAASSAYALQAAQAVENMYFKDWLEKKPKISIDKGDVSIVLRPKKNYGYMVFNMLQMVAIGYNILESKYPEYVEVIPFGSRKRANIKESRT